MASLEELSVRLMKPAKDLADWNFPFAEVLEEYYTLVSQQDVNLNKAALILQNSANAYVRRVEYLFQDTAALIQTVVDQEAVSETKKNTKKDGKEKKTVIDIIDFEPIDFSQYVTTNINIKNRNGVTNFVKLLGQRFPQLENSSRPSKLDEVNPIETDQEHDDDRDIGKKYAFRCNQYITASGMLVEHLKPEDKILDISDGPSSVQSLDISTESPDRCADLNACADNREFVRDIDPERILDSQRCVVSTPLPDTENDFMETSFCSAVDSGRGSSIQTTTRPESSLSSDQGGNWDSSQLRSCSSLSIGDVNSLVEPVNGADPEITRPTTDAHPENDEIPSSDTSPSKRSADEQENIAGNLDINATNPSIETDRVAVQKCRRSKRLRSLFDAVKTPDSRPLEPIPFESVPDELPKSRTEFKLPCPISLLKFKERPRKRKITSEPRKGRCLEKFLFNEYEIGSKKMIMYSPTRQFFFPFMKEEFEDLPKYFTQHLRNCRKFEAIHYEAAINKSMDLLGYKTRDHKPDSLDYELTNASDVTTTDIPDSVDDFPMPDTPESSNSPESTTPPPLTYNSRIERLVHDIYESADVRTEEEEAVIKWHQDIQLKLRDVKRRPKFQMAEYTERVKKSLKANNGKMTFKEMVRQDKSPEAARYLLASLMLANKYNLHIDTSDDDGNVILVLLKD